MKQMKKYWYLFFLAATLLVGCSAEPSKESAPKADSTQVDTCKTCSTDTLSTK